MSFESYRGGIPVAAGFMPRNGRDFPLLESHSIQVKEDGTRLDDTLGLILEQLSGSTADLKDMTGLLGWLRAGGKEMIDFANRSMVIYKFTNTLDEYIGISDRGLVIGTDSAKAKLRTLILDYYKNSGYDFAANPAERRIYLDWGIENSVQISEEERKLIFAGTLEPVARALDITSHNYFYDKAQRRIKFRTYDEFYQEDRVFNIVGQYADYNQAGRSMSFERAFKGRDYTVQVSRDRKLSVRRNQKNSMKVSSDRKLELSINSRTQRGAVMGLSSIVSLIN